MSCTLRTSFSNQLTVKSNNVRPIRVECGVCSAECPGEAITMTPEEIK
ncbi:MAG: hypothetical protein ACFFD4_23585 [Candidatus Odinarchaeota archaeon]